MLLLFGFGISGGLSTALDPFLPMVSSVVASVLDALPGIPAVHAFAAAFPDLLYTYSFTRYSAAPLLWILLYTVIILGPPRLSRPPDPPPRHLRRHLDRLAFRSSRHRFRGLLRPSFRHPRYQPSRSACLRRFQSGTKHSVTEGGKPGHRHYTQIPEYHSHLHVSFNRPTDCNHRPPKFCSRPRWTSPTSRKHQRLKLLHIMRAYHQKRARTVIKRHRYSSKPERDMKRKAREHAAIQRRVKEWDLQLLSSQLTSERLLNAEDSDFESILSSSERSHGHDFSAWLDSDEGLRDYFDFCTECGANISDPPEPSTEWPSWWNDDGDEPLPQDDVQPTVPLTVHLYNLTIGSSVASFVTDHLFLASHQTELKPAFPVIWDSGASICVTPHKEDIVGPMGPPPQSSTKGVGGPVEVKGSGHVAWTFKTKDNHFRKFILPAVYIPAATQRLLSTSSLCQAYPDEIVTQNATGMTLSGNQASKRTQTRAIQANVDSGNNLPTAWAFFQAEETTNVETTCEDDTTVITKNTTAKETPTASCRSTKIPPQHATMHAAISEVCHHNINLNDGDREWLKWHQRLGHRAFATIRYLLSTGTLAKSQRARTLHTQISKQVECPKCAACCYAKAKKRPRDKPRTHARVKDAPSSLRNDILDPGQEVSVDHLVSSVPGRTYEGFGKGHKTQMFRGSALFVDNATSYTYVHHQKSLNTHDTLRGKEAFEANCRDLGVVPQRYRSDNASVFHSHEYKRHLEQFSQTQRFAGVGQHHANGIVEKTIQDIQSTARTMLVHLAIHWPDQADLALWPMAIDHAVFLHNHMPDTNTGLSPMDKFSRQRWPHSKYHDIHVFGCPTYVLNKKIADGKTLPKFQPRSERHVYLGFSPFHASTVPLVLNPRTGSITPQYHCVFDDWFATLATSIDDVPDFMTAQWQTLFGDSEYQFPADNTDHPSENSLHYPERYLWTYLRLQWIYPCYLKGQYNDQHQSNPTSNKSVEAHDPPKESQHQSLIQILPSNPTPAKSNIPPISVKWINQSIQHSMTPKIFTPSQRIHHF